MNQNDKSTNRISPELNDDALESVAGGRGADEYNYFGSPAAQADTVPTMPPVLLHRVAKLEENESTRIADHL